jgi:hypothetical protein
MTQISICPDEPLEAEGDDDNDGGTSGGEDEHEEATPARTKKKHSNLRSSIDLEVDLSRVLQSPDVSCSTEVCALLHFAGG